MESIKRFNTLENIVEGSKISKNFMSAVKAKREEKHGFLIKMINCQCSQHKCFSDKSDELSDTTNRMMILKLQNIKANEAILQKLTLGLVSAISLGCLSIVLLN